MSLMGLKSRCQQHNREEPNLTRCWICFFYFNLCFLLLLFTKRNLSIHNGLPRGTLPLRLNVKPKCLCSGKHPDPVHLWMAARKKKLTHPLPEAGHSRGHLQILPASYFTSSSPPPLCAIKETGIQTPIRWLFRDISPPSSRSAGFLNKVLFLASTPRLRFIGLSWGERSELGLGNDRAFFLLEALEENPFPCLFQLLEASCIPHPVAPICKEHHSNIRFYSHISFLNSSASLL